MENFTLYIQEIMRNVAAALQIPVMIILLLLIVYALYCVGSVIVEYFTERRHFRVTMANSINAIHDAPYDKIVGVIQDTKLLKPQKEALTIVANNMGLPDEDLFALAKSETSKVDSRYRRIVSHTELVTKIAPMMGLMCTLIPLGPGIVAMGSGDVSTLSSSLLVAFDGTVAGLVGAVVAMCCSTLRKRWYNEYLVSIESLMSTILEKAEEGRAEGAKLPTMGDTALPVGVQAVKASSSEKSGE